MGQARAREDHTDFCDLEAHRPPLDDTSRQATPCVGPIEAQASSVAAWLVASGFQTMVELDHAQKVAIPVQEFLIFCLQGAAMALKGGAVLPFTVDAPPADPA